MRAGNLRRYTALFCLLLLAGGVLRRLATLFGAEWDTFLVILRGALYAGLLLGWLSSVRTRLLPSPARSYILVSGGLLLLLLLLQNVRYRVLPDGVDLTRWCWYAYYIPMILVPALFAMSCIHMSRGIPGQTDLAPLIPSVLLALGVLSNDLHHWAFLPKAGTEAFIGKDGTYTYGFLFYAVCVWIGICTAAGLGMLVRATRREPRRALPVFLLMPLWLLLLTLADRVTWWPYTMTETFCICSAVTLEACIRTRLIPHNENYRGFFGHMEIPAAITDRGMETLYTTAAPLEADREQLAAALEGPVELTEGLRLHGKAVSAGNVFWAEDESALNRMRRELEDANETIEMENDLLRYENEQKEERARVDARNRLYECAAREVYPAQKRLEALIDRTEPGSPAFRDRMAEICVLNAYIKRRANFVLLSEERNAITAAEMKAALSESAVYLGYCGTAATVDSAAEQDIPFETAAAVLDTYEAAAEALLHRASYLWIRLRDGELRLIADCAELPALGGTPLPAEPGDEDGSACWTVRWETEGGATESAIVVTHPCGASLATMDDCSMGRTRPFPRRELAKKEVRPHAAIP